MATNVIQLPSDGLASLTMGTTTITGGTTGSVLFIGSGATIAQDNSNFFWDDTNNRLGIGVNSTLGAKIQVNAGAASETCLILKAASSQTATLQEWQNSSGTVLASINKDGLLKIAAGGGTVSGYSIDIASSGTHTPSVRWAHSDYPLGLRFYSNSTEIARFQDNAVAVFTAIGTYGGLEFGSFYFRRGASGPSVGLGDTSNNDPQVLVSNTAGTGSPGGMLRVDCATASTPGAIVRGAASQTADLQQWQGSTGGVLLSVGKTGMLCFAAQTELTIATGAVTATKSYHTIDTESDAATDDLDTISGGTEGDFLIIRANNTARTVVAKDGTGNLKLNGDFTMDNTEDTLTLIFDGSNWLEVSRSDNGA